MAEKLKRNWNFITELSKNVKLMKSVQYQKKYIDICHVSYVVYVCHCCNLQKCILHKYEKNGVDIIRN